jgi:hypothetical protein
MTTSTTARLSYRGSLATAFLVLVSLGQAFPALAQDKSERQKTFASDRQACKDGKSGQELGPCMKEAGAVLNERDASTASVSPEQLQRNRLMRCEAFKGDDHSDCIARTQGLGTTSGSVGGGGILRELVTTTK